MSAKLLAAVSAACLLASSSARAENARLPYSLVCGMEKVQAELALSHTNLIVLLRMMPTNAAVKPGNVHAFIDSKSGHIPVAIDDQGDFKVPLRDDLITEDPWIITDQPKGTMKIDWGIALVAAQVSNPIRYRLLMQPIKDRAYVETRMREVFPAVSTIKVTGMKIAFPSSATAPYGLVAAKDGSQKFSANTAREVFIPLNEKWLDEDPEVQFSEQPDHREMAGE
jgi:hypothetical protein